MSRRRAAAALLPLLLGGCQRHESAEATRARAQEAFLVDQITGVRALIAKAESGQLVTQDRIAIGISEDVVKALVNASLPPEQLLGGRVRVRVESAEPVFRGNNAGMIFRAAAHGTTFGTAAHLELGGKLSRFRIEKGRLMSSIELAHIKVLDSSLGDIASDVLERLVQENMGAISEQLPALQIPVQLEEAIPVNGFSEGPVAVKSGVLPLKMTLAEVLPLNRRLWVLIDVAAGPWQRAADAEGPK